MNIILKQLRLVVAQSSILVGGQAVMEGVMMRVPGAYATAVRDPEGKIQLDRHDFQSVLEKKPQFKKPVLRGMVGLFEALKIGYSTLQWSAQIVEPEASSENSGKLADVLLTLASIGLAIGLFFAAPIGLTSWLFDKDQDALVFNLISGMFRVVFFITYLALISLMKDVKRLFQYHGAEHKTVYNFESGKDLEIETAQTFPTQHPRCGTSFMFIIMIVAILSFSVLDSIIMLWVDELKVWMRLLIHIPFIPVVAGFGYEVLKATAKHRENILFRALSKPGLWLQNITTRQPENDQVEVAMEALKSAFGDNMKRYTGKSYVAEAIG
ncbi:MAG: DUF1385 domain-containing protein [Candidatus Marinimicrobia bacterium]|jgi:uncharacterized protein YqhQ|nr:DUF1385 domain-containing protein [Candidatus Neomarinimicrobiota bacterium]MDP6852508.1 DUF1385 domain-containing protein [Candidatus Neomarinimicrobiota bacterium]MDP6936047.1 DUF1385 domain-containing protein [Candidatus Neomarinimicrobiota bacterium]